MKVSTSNIAIQTDLTWSNGEDKYKTILDIEKTKINSDCKGNKQNSKAAQVSLVGKNHPKGLPIGEPGPSKPMSGKEEEKTTE